MSISILFSLVIYKGITLEVERSLRIQQFRLYRETHPFDFLSPDRISVDTQLLDDVEGRIVLTLLFINLGIWVISGAAGYFLAGRTLRPIQQMVEDQNRFITDASHELRTPLTSLKSEIEIYLRGKNHTKEETEQLLKSNLEEVDNLQILSDNLLQLTHDQQSFNGKVSLEKIHLEKIITEAARKIKPIAAKKNIFIENNVKEYSISGDENSLEQLFIIFLDNAVKYSPNNTKITVNMEHIDHSVLVTIADQGIGIAKKDIPHIFERFYRADISRTKQKESGYGLGLSIAKKIVELHDGAINVKSTLGKGTTFTIQFTKLG